MPRVTRLSGSIFSIFISSIVVGCSSANEISSGANGAGAGGSSESDAAASSSGGDGGGSGASSGGTSGAGGRLGATGGAGGSNLGGTGGDGPILPAPCAFSKAPPPPTDVDPNASQEAQANATALRMLDYLIGRYLRSEVTVYKGTTKAGDNRSELVNSIVAGPRPDGMIAQGPALAYLQVRPALNRDWFPQNPDPSGTTATLVVHGLPPDQHFIFRQHSIEPGRTEVSLLAPVATTASMSTSCRDCAPDLGAKPATIAFTDLTATGQMKVFMGYAGDGGHDVDVTARVTASADLSILPPCALRFEDLVVLEGATGPDEIGRNLSVFQKNGNDMVYTMGGSFTVGGTLMCPLVQSYTIQVYVDLGDLGHYGTRNFVAGTPTVSCLPGSP